MNTDHEISLNILNNLNFYSQNRVYLTKSNAMVIQDYRYFDYMLGVVVIQDYRYFDYMLGVVAPAKSRSLVLT